MKILVAMRAWLPSILMLLLPSELILLLVGQSSVEKCQMMPCTSWEMLPHPYWVRLCGQIYPLVKGTLWPKVPSGQWDSGQRIQAQYLQGNVICLGLEWYLVLQFLLSGTGALIRWLCREPWHPRILAMLREHVYLLATSSCYLSSSWSSLAWLQGFSSLMMLPVLSLKVSIQKSRWSYSFVFS